jgi:hypothetical protein
MVDNNLPQKAYENLKEQKKAILDFRYQGINARISLEGEGGNLPKMYLFLYLPGLFRNLCCFKIFPLQARISDKKLI